MTEMINPQTALPPTPPPQDQNSRNHDKTNYYNGTIADQLVLSGRVVYNLKYDRNTREMMAPFGYNQEKIGRFSVVQQEAADANNDQQIEYAEKTIAYRTFEKNFKTAKKELSSLVKVAKVALKNDPIFIEKLDLYGNKGDTINKTLNYMKNFYNNIFNIAGIVTKLAAFGYNEAKLSVCRNTFACADEDYNKFQNENADAHESTRIRDEKMAELNEWMYDYYALAKVAYLQRNDFIEEPNNNQ